MGHGIRLERCDRLPVTIDHDAQPSMRNTDERQPLFDRTKGRGRDELCIDYFSRYPTVICEIHDGNAFVIAASGDDFRKEHLEAKHGRESELATQGSGDLRLFDSLSSCGLPEHAR